DLTDNVNSMASNLTTQVRGIATVVTAVANGDLKRKLVFDAKGEIATLADTINGMIDTLAIFGDQVTSVAREVGIEGKLGGQAKVPGAAGSWRDLTDNVNQLAANLTTQVRAIAEVATAVTQGDFSRAIGVQAQGEVAALKDNINEMIRNLKDTTRKNAEQDWLKTNLAKFTRMLQGQRDMLTVSKLILSELAPLVSAQHGVFYLEDADPDGARILKLLASYAYKERKHLANRFKLGEGLIGECALEKEKILITDVPTDYIQVSSGLGEAKPLNIAVLPVLFEGQVKAVIELASFQRFNDTHLVFLEQLTESIGIVPNTIAATMRTEDLLKQSQKLAGELQSQQRELTETNRRLEDQAKTLKKSEELLKKQQEELRQTNEELEEKARLLSAQKSEVERKNREVEEARRALEEKAEQLALTSKYKSEFLANMSHELRTPLNSLLILAKMLGENTDSNLTVKQVDFAKTIHSAGSDLLELINDILDLSKIESGTVTVEVSEVGFADLGGYVERTFRQVAEAKGLTFGIEPAADLPVHMETDAKRLQQVLKNLLSNAFKFTETGSVHLLMGIAQAGWSADQELLNRAPGVIAFAVRDTGIGIPLDKQQIIFEAFQQAEGSTSRKYGGTGLGLSISREIARLLGGEVCLVSEVGRGSTFTLYLPLTYTPPPKARPQERPARRLPTPSADGAAPERAQQLSTAVLEAEMPASVEPRIADDRTFIQPLDRVLLIVEDDADFARILLDMARERGFKGIVSLRANQAIALAREYGPAAITLDLRLPDADGWTVLDRLKHDSFTRHIPVHIISVDEDWQRARKLGALDFLQKPATKEALADALTRMKDFVERSLRKLLVVEDNDAQRQSMVELVTEKDIQITAVATAAEALKALRAEHFDCMVLDLMLPDLSGPQLIEKIKTELGLRDLPIIIYTGKELSRREETELRRVAEAIVVKDVSSPERLLDETALFLHRVEANLPEAKRRMLQQVHQADPLLAGKKVLIIDDDVRNIFALTSILEHHKMQVAYAESGQEGIDLLTSTPGIDMVLMDVMMPEMDGYEATRAIRRMEAFRDLPIIALTAKAMKGDREKCIEAGTSDYIAKPVDTEQLLSLLRVWLYR
ncbi:MAG: response regulator, partial [Planctomycetes bacterium]|nr:response regulator [Planctomycetota bacterium]